MLCIEEGIISVFPETTQCLHKTCLMIPIINMNAIHGNVVNVPSYFPMTH